MGTFDYTYEERQRDTNSELYVPFYIESPVEDLEVTISAEAANVITVTCQLVDPGGDEILERMAVRMLYFDSADYDALGSAIDVVIAWTDGMEVEVNNTGTDIDCLTDDDGLLVMTFTNAADADIETWLGFILPNGKFVEGGHMAFVDDTP